MKMQASAVQPSQESYSQTEHYEHVSLYTYDKRIKFTALNYLSLPSLDFAESCEALDVPGFFDADCRLEKNPDGFADI